MSEDFLHFLWKNGLYQMPLTEFYSGETIEVLNPGLHNRDQGPDFFNARIRIGQTVWAGNVEIHLRSSDWLRHRHQSDDHYNNVVRTWWGRTMPKSAARRANSFPPPKCAAHSRCLSATNS